MPSIHEALSSIAAVPLPERMRERKRQKVSGNMGKQTKRSRISTVNWNSQS